MYISHAAGGKMRGMQIVAINTFVAIDASGWACIGGSARVIFGAIKNIALPNDSQQGYGKY